MEKYKNIRSIIIGGMIMILSSASISCAGIKNSVENIKENKSAVSEKKAVDENYSGSYRLTDAKICNIVITIKKDKSDYTYAINGTGVNSSGTKRSGDKTAVEGAYSNNTITVQNYGNSMNQYVCFKSCDAKYLEFVKAD
ncbi:MAG: hypothetical protein CVV49_20420 [Spirochaetae bacterium HGW-Spirochaetae-5]|nr:MAG: hypothetical protein CVV49_20420 [Spirochaetae bacterium HGW-Spirochaetae-5]